MDDDCYSKFIDALKRSEQDHVAAMLTNVDEELEIVNKCRLSVKYELLTITLRPQIQHTRELSMQHLFHEALPIYHIKLVAHDPVHCLI